MKQRESPPGLVKSIITIMLTTTFCYLAIWQNVAVSSEMLGNIFFSVITYFFTKSSIESKYRNWTPPPKSLHPVHHKNPDEIDELNG
jgi:hypothetical protein